MLIRKGMIDCTSFISYQLHSFHSKKGWPGEEKKMLVTSSCLCFVITLRRWKNFLFFVIFRTWWRPLWQGRSSEQRMRVCVGCKIIIHCFSPRCYTEKTRFHTLKVITEPLAEHISPHSHQGEPAHLKKKSWQRGAWSCRNVLQLWAGCDGIYRTTSKPFCPKLLRATLVPYVVLSRYTDTKPSSKCVCFCVTICLSDCSALL